MTVTSVSCNESHIHDTVGQLIKSQQRMGIISVLRDFGRGDFELRRNWMSNNLKILNL